MCMIPLSSIVLLTLFTISISFPTRPPCPTPINLQIPATSPPFCNSPLFILKLTSLPPHILSSLHTLPHSLTFLVSPPYLSQFIPTLRKTTQAGNTLILYHPPGTLPSSGNDLFESLLGFPPIFTTGDPNSTTTLPLINLDKPFNALFDLPAIDYAQTTPACRDDNGLLGRLSVAQLTFVYHRLNCDFTAPGELLWRLCKNIRKENRRQGGGTLGQYAVRREEKGVAEETERVEGFLRRNRRRVAMARGKVAGVNGIDESKSVLWEMSEVEVGKGAQDGGAWGRGMWWGLVQWMRWGGGLGCLVFGVGEMVKRVRGGRRRWKVLAKAADFGKIV